MLIWNVILDWFKSLEDITKEESKLSYAPVRTNEPILRKYKGDLVSTKTNEDGSYDYV